MILRTGNNVCRPQFEGCVLRVVHDAGIAGPVRPGLGRGAVGILVTAVGHSLCHFWCGISRGRARVPETVRVSDVVFTQDADEGAPHLWAIEDLV